MKVLFWSRAGKRQALLLCALGAFFGFSTVARAQSCVPDCRDGYVCVKDKCVSACNPPCAKGETCSADAECVSATPAATAGSYVAPKDKALVVFVREKGARQDHFTVFDEQPQFLTVIEKVRTHVKAVVEPGQHTFYFGDIVRADLAAGRTYVIRMHAKTTVWGWDIEVEPALRKNKSVAEASQWIRESKLDSPNLAKRAAQWEKKVNTKRMNKSIVASEAAWANGTDEYRAARTIRKNDGFTSAEAASL